MFFWVITITRYVLVACGAILMSVALSFLSVLPLAHDDAPGFGFLWLFVFLAEASLLTAISLGVTAELMDRKVHERRFRWSKALERSLLALPISIGPLYAIVCVAPYIDSRRPNNWVAKEVFFYFLSSLICVLRFANQ